MGDPQLWLGFAGMTAIGIASLVFLGTVGLVVGGWILGVVTATATFGWIIGLTFVLSRGSGARGERSRRGPSWRSLGRVAKM